MPEKTKKNEIERAKNEKNPCSESEKDLKDENSTWEEDQKKRGYYYDDAHGYEIYRPEDEDSDDED